MRKKNQPGAPCCNCGGAPPAEIPCSHCSGGSPQQLQIVIDGVIDGGLGPNCPDMNGTYVVPIHPTLDCEWHLDGVGGVGGDPCALGGGTGWNLRAILFYDEFTPNYFLVVNATVNLPDAFPDTMQWRVDFGPTAPDCSSWSGLSVPWLNNGGACCDSDTTPALVTAL